MSRMPLVMASHRNNMLYGKRHTETSEDMVGFGTQSNPEEIWKQKESKKILLHIERDTDKFQKLKSESSTALLSSVKTTNTVKSTKIIRDEAWRCFIISKYLILEHREDI